MRRAWITFWAVLMVLASGTVVAQSAAQLELLKNLPEEQKRALLRQYAPELDQGQSPSFEEAPPVVQPERGPDSRTPSGQRASMESGDEVANSEQLQAFGYDLFRGRPTTFAPVSDIPVPSDYVLGPGDQLSLRLTGKESDRYELVIDRSGNIFVPDIGTLSLAGLSFDQAREIVRKRISQAKLGIQADLEMGELRNIRIFVTGDARNPGSYTVSALATITQALYVSGGVDTAGSLRRIQLKRNGRTVRTLDLYDLLLAGDASNDARLQAGDVIFIPSVGTTVGIQGAVRRPAIYEVGRLTTVQDMIPLAGGLVPGAVVDRVTVERVENGFRRLRQARLDGGDELRVQAGDRIRVLGAESKADTGVTVQGPARFPGTYPVSDSTRFTDIVRSPADLLPGTDLDFALIMRRIDAGSNLRALYLSPRAAFAGDVGANVSMRPGDELYLFAAATTKADPRPQRAIVNESGRTVALGAGLSQQDLDAAEDVSAEGAQTTSSRAAQMKALAERLQSLARESKQPDVITVTGAVRFPGAIPFDRTRPNLPSVLRAVGGLPYTAEQAFIEVSRTYQKRQNLLEVAPVTMRIDSDMMRTYRLLPGDVVAVRSLPGAREQHTVTILGEVLYPGSYAIGPDVTLADIVERAGGALPTAYLAGSVFTREKLQEKERLQVDRLRQRLRADIATAALTSANPNQSGGASADAFVALQGLLDELGRYPALGRLVVDVEKQLLGGGLPVVLQDGDTLIIPPMPEEVTITGEVQSPTSLRWEPRKETQDYLRLAGGTTRLADEKRAFVVHANGSVEPLRRGWFRGSPNVLPGDVIVVPLDATPIAPITLVSTLSQVVSQIALSLAAFNAIGAF